MATWRNLCAPSSIELTQLNGNDSHHAFHLSLFIEDEEPNPMTTPKFCLFICIVFDEKCILGCFKLSNCLDI